MFTRYLIIHSLFHILPFSLKCTPIPLLYNIPPSSFPSTPKFPLPPAPFLSPLSYRITFKVSLQRSLLGLGHGLDALLHRHPKEGLVGPQLKLNGDLHGWVGVKHGVGKSEDDQREPDDEDDEEQQEATDAVLDGRFLFLRPWGGVGLARGGNGDIVNTLTLSLPLSLLPSLLLDACQQL